MQKIKRRIGSGLTFSWYALSLGTVLVFNTGVFAQGNTNSATGTTGTLRSGNTTTGATSNDLTNGRTNNNAATSNNTGVNSGSPANGTGSSLNTGRSMTAPVNTSGGRDTIDGNSEFSETGTATGKTTPLLYGGVLVAFLAMVFLLSRIGKKDPQPGRGTSNPQ